MNDEPMGLEDQAILHAVAKSGADIDVFTLDTGRLFPEDPCLGFVAQLIDEAFDAFGLYMVHHKRWVLSAASNDAGRRLAREFARVLF